jgi:hypothetical protein
MNRYLLIRRLYGPAYLLLVGVLALLAQSTNFGWGKSWPLFILLAGVLKLAEFIVLRTDAPAPQPPAWQPGQPYPGYPQQAPPPAADPGSAIVTSDPTYEEKK